MAKKAAVLIRCYSGVFHGYIKSRKGSEVVGTFRHIWSWTSNGLTGKALTVDDLAIIGAGTGTKISRAASQTLLDVKQIVDSTQDATRIIEALPCQ